MKFIGISRARLHGYGFSSAVLYATVCAQRCMSAKETSRQFAPCRPARSLSRSPTSRRSTVQERLSNVRTYDNRNQISAFGRRAKRRRFWHLASHPQTG